MAKTSFFESTAILLLIYLRDVLNYDFLQKAKYFLGLYNFQIAQQNDCNVSIGLLWQLKKELMVYEQGFISPLMYCSRLIQNWPPFGFSF